MPNSVDLMEKLGGEAACGGLIPSILEVLSTTGSEKADLLFALGIAGMVMGAGAWIAIEVCKSARDVMLAMKKGMARKQSAG